jgi:hypothetical protein
MFTGTVPSPAIAAPKAGISTRFVDLAGSVLDAGAWLALLEGVGAGRLDQFHVRSPNTDFRVWITVDGVSVFNKSYAEIRQISQNSPEISAFAELDEDGNPTGYYVASIRDIPYGSSISIRVQNTGLAPVTLSQLFAKYMAKED